MWDFNDIDTDGTVVHVHFPDPENDMRSIKRDYQSHVRRYYELCKVSGNFHYITEHYVSQDLEYTTRDFIIPLNMVYLEKVGTVTEFSNGIKYYYSNKDGIDVKSLSQEYVVKKVIEYVTGEHVFIDTPKDWEMTVRNTSLKVKDFMEYVTESVISVDEIIDGRGQ